MPSEIETVITWSADEDRATVYSLMPKVWRWCERAGGEEIRLDEGIRDGRKAARTFLVPVQCIRIRPKQKRGPLSQAHLEALHAGRDDLRRRAKRRKREAHA
jgi:hypothetical protein